MDDGRVGEEGLVARELQPEVRVGRAGEAGEARPVERELDEAVRAERADGRGREERPAAAAELHACRRRGRAGVHEDEVRPVARGRVGAGGQLPDDAGLQRLGDGEPGKPLARDGASPAGVHVVHARGDEDRSRRLEADRPERTVVPRAPEERLQDVVEGGLGARLDPERGRGDRRARHLVVERRRDGHGRRPLVQDPHVGPAVGAVGSRAVRRRRAEDRVGGCGAREPEEAAREDERETGANGSRLHRRPPAVPTGPPDVETRPRLPLCGTRRAILRAPRPYGCRAHEAGRIPSPAPVRRGDADISPRIDRFERRPGQVGGSPGFRRGGASGAASGLPPRAAPRPPSRRRARGPLPRAP